MCRRYLLRGGSFHVKRWLPGRLQSDVQRVMILARCQDHNQPAGRSADLPAVRVIAARGNPLGPPGPELPVGARGRWFAGCSIGRKNSIG